MLGTPCNQFGGQEPGDNDEILNGLKYVRPGNGFVPAFPLTQALSVNGAFADAIYNYFRVSCPNPTAVITSGPAWSPVQVGDLTWNFNSFLVDKQGNVRKRYESLVQPQDQVGDIQALLAE